MRACVWVAALAARACAQVFYDDRVGENVNAQYDTPNFNTLEARLTLDCRLPEKDELKTYMGTCSTMLRSDNSKLYQRTGWRWVGQITYAQDYLRFPENQPKSTNGYWYDRVYNYAVGCDTRLEYAGRYCRQLMVCSMREELWSTLNGPDGNPWPDNTWNPPVHLYSTTSVKDAATLYAPHVVPKCLVCPVLACPYYNCTNGLVAGSALPTVLGKVVEPPVCSVPCAPGTFLTCRTGETCNYQALTDVEERAGDAGNRKWYAANMYELRVDANIMPVDRAPPPVSKCYPCWLAKDRLHYGAIVSSEDALFYKNFLRFYCPGGAAPPALCGPRLVSKFSAATGAGSACGCEEGYYHNATYGTCWPCEAGFFCAWKDLAPPVPEECPTDTYSIGGAASCTKCDLDRTCDKGRALTRCRRAQGAEQKGSFQREQSKCVPCEECQQLRGPTPCYKVSPRLSAM